MHLPILHIRTLPASQLDARTVHAVRAPAPTATSSQRRQGRRRYRLPNSRFAVTTQPEGAGSHKLNPVGEGLASGAGVPQQLWTSIGVEDEVVEEAHEELAASVAVFLEGFLGKGRVGGHCAGDRLHGFGG